MYLPLTLVQSGLSTRPITCVALAVSGFDQACEYRSSRI